MGKKNPTGSSEAIRMAKATPCPPKAHLEWEEQRRKLIEAVEEDKRRAKRREEKEKDEKLKKTEANHGEDKEKRKTGEKAKEKHAKETKTPKNTAAASKTKEDEKPRKKQKMADDVSQPEVKPSGPAEAKEAKEKKDKATGEKRKTEEKAKEKKAGDEEKKTEARASSAAASKTKEDETPKKEKKTNSKATRKEGEEKQQDEQDHTEMSLVLAVPRPLVATSAAGGSEGDKPTEKEQQDGKSKHIKPKRKAETHEDDRNAKAIKDGKDDGKAKKSLSQDRILPWVWVTGVYIGIFNLFYFDILTLVVPSNLDFKYVIYIHITYSSKGLGPIDLERIPSSLSQLLLSRRC